MRILSYIVIGLLFLVPFTALVVSNDMFFPFITGKNFLFRIFVEIAFAGWVILAVRDPAYRPGFSWPMVAVGAFLAVIGIANALGPNPFDSFWSNFERMEGYVTMLHLGAFFVVAAGTLRKRALWTWFFHVLLAVSIVLGFGGLADGSIKDGATLGNEIYLAIYALIHAFIAFFYLVQMWGRRMLASALYALVVMFELGIMFATQVRGSVVGLAAGLGVMAILTVVFARPGTTLRRTAAVLLVIGVLVGGAGSMALYENNWGGGDQSGITKSVNEIPMLGTFATLNLTDVNSATTRFYTAKMGLQGFLDRPLRGWGQENYKYAFNKYYDPAIYDRESWFDRSHNVLVDWMVHGGVPGLIVYLGLWAALLWAFWKASNELLSRPSKIILTGLLAAYFVHNLFVFDSITTYILFFMLLAFGAVLTQRSDGRPLFGTRPAPAWGAYLIAAPLAVCVAAVSFYFTVSKPARASETLIQALTTADSRVARYETSRRLFDQALALNTLGNQEIREQLVTTARSVRRRDDASREVKSAFTKDASEAMKTHIERYPDEVRPRTFFARLLHGQGRSEDAAAMLQEALKRSPRKIHILRNLGLFQLESEQFDAALATFKRAHQLTPDDDQYRILYAMAARYAGDEALVTEIVEPLSKETKLFSDRLLRPYRDMGDDNKILEVQKERVAFLKKKLDDDGTDGKTLERMIRAKASLADTYARMGRMGQANALLDEVVRKHPAMEDQVKELRKQLEDRS